MFNITCPEEVGNDAEHHPPDGEYHRIRPDRQDELGPIQARCHKDIDPATKRHNTGQRAEPHAIAPPHTELPAAHDCQCSHLSHHFHPHNNIRSDSYHHLENKQRTHTLN